MKFVALLLMLATLAACQPKAGGPTPSSSGATDQMGTSSGGGGGNGIDGKALELYSINVENLPEYRRYIAPIIAKIEYGQGDVLAVYMKWVVKHKTWYMVKKDLQSLPKEQVGVTFDTEQLARHSEHEIYIHEPSYNSEKNKPSDRAELLMHEIVMGARLLMKKSAKEQCEALEASKPQVCANPKILTVAQNPSFTHAEAITMDDEDTESVRAMTVYLMSHSHDVTGPAVRALRRQLGFVFPWDRLVSTLTPEDVAAAIRRTAVAVGPFISSKPKIGDVETSCFYDIQTDDVTHAMALHVWNASTQLMPLEIKDQPPGSALGDIDWRDHKEVRLSFDEADVVALNVNFSAHGVLDPQNPQVMDDLVSVEPQISLDAARDWAAPGAPPGPFGKQIKLLISREEKPRVLQISASDVNIVFLKPSKQVDSESDYELQTAPQPLLVCKSPSVN